MALIILLSLALSVLADPLPSSFPHIYSGQPAGSLSPQWQSYYEVTSKLPNVTFSLEGRSFAGNIPVDRAGHPNDTLFFWAFEKQNGSLTDTNSSEPWGIWLNGGPGSSSLIGLFFENGPIRINADYSASANNYSWHKVADYIWVDQPVGTGFSTADSDGYIADDDQMGQDFMGFLGNLVKVFPALATRPLHITGESYAGNWIPYITKAYFGMKNPPVKITKIAIGDGTVPSGQVFELLPALDIVETYPQLIGYDPDVYNYFKEQTHLCKYDINLTYPQNGLLPSVALIESSQRDVLWEMQQKATSKGLFKTLLAKNQQFSAHDELSKRSREEAHATWKRDLAGRANGTIDPWYGCILIAEFVDYAVNFSFPWTLCQDDPNQGCFDYYDIQDALDPEINSDDASLFLNNNITRAAIHAPTSKDWQPGVQVYANQVGDPSPEPMVFLTELASNATAQNLSIILYSGNDDALITHRGTEVAIQNTTFGGIQGFTRKPSTPWYDDTGNFAGIVHQERNWTYVLFYGAGHLVPRKTPIAAFTFLREFVFGSNTTGLVTNSSNGIVVVGGENATLAEDIIVGSDEIFYGSGATLSTYVYPSATRAAWNSFIQTATAIPGQAQASAQSSTTSTSGQCIVLPHIYTSVTFFMILGFMLVM